MSEDKNYESTARADAAAARRQAYESGEITRTTSEDGPTEQRSRWDANLSTPTTPRRAIANWRTPRAVDSATDNGTAASASTEPKPSSTDDK